MIKQVFTVLSLAAIVVLAPGAFAASDFVGEWTIENERQGQVFTSKLVITETGGVLSATMEGRRGVNDLDDVKVADGKITFTRNINRQGQEFSIQYTASIQDGKMVGTVTTPRGERPFEALRAAAANVSFVGKWDVEFEVQGNSITAVLAITESDEGLKGTWTSQRGETVLSNLKSEGGALSFTRKLDMQGQEMTLENKATIVDGKLTGTIVSPMGEIPFTGKKQEEKAEQGGGNFLARFDANGDGKIQKDEAPEQMKQFWDFIDTNGDGELDAEEMARAAEMRGNR